MLFCVVPGRKPVLYGSIPSLVWMETEGRTEIKKNPRRCSAQVGDMLEHFQIVLVELCLIILTPRTLDFRVAMFAIERFASELGNEKRFAGSYIPDSLVRSQWPVMIPSHIFVDGYHVQDVDNGVIHLKVPAFAVEAYQIEGGRNQTG